MQPGSSGDGTGAAVLQTHAGSRAGPRGAPQGRGLPQRGTPGTTSQANSATHTSTACAHTWAHAQAHAGRHTAGRHTAGHSAATPRPLSGAARASPPGRRSCCRGSACQRVHAAVCGRGPPSSVHARPRGSDSPQWRLPSMAESEGALRSAAEGSGPHASHGSPEHPPGKVGGMRRRAAGRGWALARSGGRPPASA